MVNSSYLKRRKKMLSGINVNAPQMHMEEMVFREKARMKQQSVTERQSVKDPRESMNESAQKAENELELNRA